MVGSPSSSQIMARNTILLSVRLVFVLCVTLYTTRALLGVLGVDDYGLYNVVCGFVALFTFLNTSMSNGVQRFYNYELGRSGANGANRVFVTATLVQFVLLIILFIGLETAGVWYINTKLVVESSRLFAANWIYQLSVISFMFVIMQVPFTAAVMAHEKMDFYSFVSILDAVLKLLIVFAVPYADGDNLIVYSIFLTFVSVLNFFLYLIFSWKNFEEIKFNFYLDKKLIVSMLNFSGWNIFGAMSTAAKDQGINMVLNLFFGTVVNAARAVAMQVSSGLQGFVSNISIAIRPQVVQSYARGDISRSMKLTYSISKLSCILLYIIAYPLVLELDFVLNAWLDGTVPEHTSEFVIIIILTSFVNNLNAAVSGVVHASGKMRKYQVITSIIAIMSLPVAYLFLKLGFSSETALWITFVFTLLSQIAALIILKGIVNYSYRDYVIEVIVPFFLVIIISFYPPLCIRNCMDYGITRFLIVVLSSFLLSSISTYFVGLNSQEKILANSFLSKFKIKNQNK